MPSATTVRQLIPAMRAMMSVAYFAGTVVGLAGVVSSTRGSTQSSVGLVLLCTGSLVARIGSVARPWLLKH